MQDLFPGHCEMPGEMLARRGEGGSALSQRWKSRVPGRWVGF